MGIGLKFEKGNLDAVSKIATLWRPALSAGTVRRPEGAVISAEDARPLHRGLALWDIWPVQLDDGSLAPVAGGSLWVVLSAPRGDDPDERHGQARMRLLHRAAGEWRDCGHLLPEGYSPGSREWSGSTRIDPATGIVTLWFTAAGQRGDGARDFEQRLFQCNGRLDLTGDRPAIVDWQGLVASTFNDGSLYADLAVDQGVPGCIKGFRDPYWFRDPADGKGYLLFTGSKSANRSRSLHDGVIGIAAARDRDGVAGFELLPPLIDGDGVVNELERPHVFVHDGLYYLFWSSQRRVFAPEYRAFPTGLYGMVAENLGGPWEPLNGNGLVLSNPEAEPFQAYAWQVIPGTLEVVGFVDYWGLEGRDYASDPALKRAQFGGTIAPEVTISLSGATSRIVSGGA